MDGKIWVEFEEFSHQYCCTFQLMLYICLEDLYLYSVQFSSVVKSCPALCNPTDCSIPGFPVQHQLPELAQTHVHQVSDVIQLSHPMLSPSPPAFNLYQHQGLFQSVTSSHQVAKILELQLQHQSFQRIHRLSTHSAFAGETESKQTRKLTLWPSALLSKVSGFRRRL